MTLKSINKLRKYATDVVKSPQYIGGETFDLMAIANEIESEIAEKYMELPVDADGAPWHLGDVTENGNRINGMVFDTHGWYFTNTLNDIDPSIHYHAKPRTIEDVLEDFIADFDRWDDSYDDNRMERREKLFTKYADELRWLGVSDD